MSTIRIFSIYGFYSFFHKMTTLMESFMSDKLQLQKIFFTFSWSKDLTIPLNMGTRRTPPWKFSLIKLPRGEFPRRIFPRGKLPHGNLPRIYQCIFYTSFIKNEAWTCHRIKFSFACFLKSFLLPCALWICSNCESVGSLVNIG